MGRISFPQGRGNQMHNQRDYARYEKEIPKNIDSAHTSENVVIVDREIHQAYQDIFGEAVEEYNAKQKRADRRIDDYYDYISKSKNGEHLFYEDVLQWGDKDDFKAHPELREKAKDALTEYVKTFEERNPNLKIIGAYIHMDEKSPHLHLDYIPVASGYKRGLKLRNSLEKAMREMGYIPEKGKESRKNNATKLWKEAERAYFGELCKERGLEVELERPGRGQNLSVEEYYDAADKMMADIKEQLRPDPAIADIVSRTRVDGQSVALDKADFERLSNAAQMYNAACLRADNSEHRADEAEQRAAQAKAERDRALTEPQAVAEQIAKEKSIEIWKQATETMREAKKGYQRATDKAEKDYQRRANEAENAAQQKIADAQRQFDSDRMQLQKEIESLKKDLVAVKKQMIEKVMPLVAKATMLWDKYAQPLRDIFNSVAHTWYEMQGVFTYYAQNAYPEWQKPASKYLDAMIEDTPIWQKLDAEYYATTKENLCQTVQRAVQYIDRETHEIDIAALERDLDDDFGDR